MDTQIQETKTPKKNSKILNIVVDVVLILAILLAVLCAYSAFATKDEKNVPSVLGIKIFIVETGSMSPTFDEGDLVIGKKIKDASALKISTPIKNDSGVTVGYEKDGDVIFFRAYDSTIATTRVITHRLVDKQDNGAYLSFTTLGDANDKIYDFDRDIRTNAMEAKYLFRLKGFGKFIRYMQEPTGFFLVIVLPVALFFIWQLVQFFRSLFAYQAEKVRIQYQAQMAQNGYPVPPAAPVNNESAETPPDIPADKTENAGGSSDPKAE